MTQGFSPTWQRFPCTPRVRRDHETRQPIDQVKQSTLRAHTHCLALHAEHPNHSNVQAGWNSRLGRVRRTGGTGVMGPGLRPHPAGKLRDLGQGGL